jgi:hypothetical protein
MRLSSTVDVRVLAMGFAIAWNMAIAAASFLMLPILSSLHFLDLTFQESARLNQAAWIAVYFSCVPIVALIFVRLFPVSPLPPSVPDPIYDDVTSTTQIGVAFMLVCCSAVFAFLRFAGVGSSNSVISLFATAYFSMVIIYMMLISDCRRPGSAKITSDLFVAISLAIVCVAYDRREVLLMAFPLLIQKQNRIPLISILGIAAVGAALILLVMARKNDLNAGATLIRILGNQFKYLERYSFNFGLYDQCFGLSTIIPFTNPGHYQAFYNLQLDPIVIAKGGRAFRWDSSNLLERLNYAYCSVRISFALYFGFIVIMLLLAKKLADPRYFRVALMVVMGTYTGFAFFNVPLVLALGLLLLSGSWRIGRDIVLRASAEGPPPSHNIAAGGLG